MIGLSLTPVPGGRGREGGGKEGMGGGGVGEMEGSWKEAELID